MKRRAKTEQTAGRVLRFDRAGRAAHRPAARQASRLIHKQAGGDREQQVRRYEQRVQERGKTLADQAVNIVDYVTESWADARRITCMHECLTADAERLARVYWLLSGKEGSEPPG